MSKLLVLVLIGQLQTFDAPLAPNPAVELQAGASLPYHAICMDDDLAVTTAKRIVSCEATVAKAEESFLISKPVLILGIVGIVAASFAAGAAVMAATKK